MYSAMAQQIAVRAVQRADYPVCYLEDLYTLEAARGQGVARALIEAVYARAREAGGRSVYWQTHESNTVAMRLYDKMAARFGFVVYDKIL